MLCFEPQAFLGRCFMAKTSRDPLGLLSQLPPAAVVLLPSHEPLDGRQLLALAALRPDLLFLRCQDDGQALFALGPALRTAGVSGLGRLALRARHLLPGGPRGFGALVRGPLRPALVLTGRTWSLKPALARPPAARNAPRTQRPLGPADEWELRRFLGAFAFEELKLRSLTPARLPAWMDLVLGFFPRGPHHRGEALGIFAAGAAGPALLGLVEWMETGAQTAETAYLVHPAFRGLGLGAALVQEVLGRLGALGFQTAEAGCLPQNAAMMRVLEAAGFAGAPRRDGLLGYRRSL
jgi:RimJ/RimL family protein N-acetyltransferase